MAVLEQGTDSLAFSSGMAAITTVIKLFSPGDHILVSDDLYGGTYRLFEEVYRPFGYDFSYVDTSSNQAILDNLHPNTVAIFVETPSNPMMKVTDLHFVVTLCKQRSLLSIVDNTFLTPYFQRPLTLGADIVVHSGTKYLGGHNDTLSGHLVVGDDALAQKLRLYQKSEGAVLSPFDSWLILRGLKTLSVRMERQQSNALTIARWLSKHPKVSKVYYVGLPEHEGYERNKIQAEGFGAMISFSVKDAKTVKQVLDGVRLILFAESLGGVESLITYPLVQTHEAIPATMRERLGVNDRLLRLSVGVEHVEDLLEDLEQALK
jgi:cystathionine gamma-synthase